MLRTIRPGLNLAERATEDLRRAIQDDRFASGRLPAEPELAQMLGVSRTTLRHAMSVLQEEGLVSRRHGSGTFVNRQARDLRTTLNLNFGVTDLIEAAGWRARTVDLVVEARPADPEACRRLGLADGSAITVIDRTRTADDRPVAITSDFLPERTLAEAGTTVDELTARLVDEQSLYRVLGHFGIVVHHGIADVRPAKADRAMAGRLSVPVSALLIEIEQVDFDQDGSPILLSREHYVADKITVQVYRKGSGTSL